MSSRRSKTKTARSKGKRRAGKTVQGAFGFLSWGGARKGAGRKPKGAKPLVPHEVREGVKARHPLLVTTRVVPGLPSLRRHGFWRVVQRCLERACERFGVGIVHFSVQGNHLHLIVEAPDAISLARSMKGLGVRVARAVNKLAGRKGQVIADRYHHRLLRTPKEVRHALSYVLNNLRRHVKDALGLDRCSSSWWFDGWKQAPGALLAVADGPPDRAPPVASARSWLLREGWRRHGLIGADEVSGPRL
jgi:REP element-mobilizing transposase RayT